MRRECSQHKEKKEEEEKRMNVKVVIKYYLSVLRKSAIY